MQLLPDFPVLKNLLLAMLKPALKDRIKPMDVVFHPLFWSPHRKLAFLIHASDYIQAKRQTMTKFFINMRTTKIINGNWLAKIQNNEMHKAVIGLDGKYDYDSVLELVRAIRNLAIHEANWKPSFKAAFRTQ
ncbi:serine/threonine-protein kinase/endoribonuclease IRE1a-like [Prosopis cineraria]|uniref:serine/threonine-protein kinase/endoribonuclease IRE1a-like n=1 Tax=Prosopis cineraria TaxID=364024 RepID=UPI00240F4DD0|nr:serine/threonine-protein kinase/endoribonuclease IRE1a-like [Prosopis cineraria]